MHLCIMCLLSDPGNILTMSEKALSMSARLMPSTISWTSLSVVCRGSRDVQSFMGTITDQPNLLPSPYRFQCSHHPPSTISQAVNDIPTTTTTEGTRQHYCCALQEACSDNHVSSTDSSGDGMCRTVQQCQTRHRNQQTNCSNHFDGRCDYWSLETLLNEVWNFSKQVSLPLFLAYRIKYRRPNFDISSRYMIHSSCVSWLSHCQHNDRLPDTSGDQFPHTSNPTLLLLYICQMSWNRQIISPCSCFNSLLLLTPNFRIRRRASKQGRTCLPHSNNSTVQLPCHMANLHPSDRNTSTEHDTVLSTYTNCSHCNTGIVCTYHATWMNIITQVRWWRLWHS